MVGGIEQKENILTSLHLWVKFDILAVDFTQKTYCLVQHQVLGSALTWEAVEVEEMKVGEKAIIWSWLLGFFMVFK